MQPPADAGPVTRSEALSLVAILTIYAFLQAPWLLNPWLHDTVSLFATSLDLARGDLDTLFPLPYVTAAYLRLAGEVGELVGPSLLVPRVLAACATVVSALLVWALCRAVAGPAAALGGVALYVLSPLVLSLPTVGAPNLPLFVLGGAVLLLEGVRRDDLRLVAAAGAVAGLSVYVRLFYGPMLPVLGLCALLLPARGRRGKTWAAFVAGGVAADLPMLGVLAFTDAGRELFGFVADASTGDLHMHTALGSALDQSLFARTIQTWRTLSGVVLGTMDSSGPAPRAFPDVVAGALVLGGLALCLRRAREPGPKLILLYGAGALAALIFLFAWPSEQAGPDSPPYRSPRYLVLFLPVPSLLAALALEAAGRWLRDRGRPPGPMLVPLVVLSAGLPIAYQHVLDRLESPFAEAEALVARELDRLRAETGQTPWLLSDVPIGAAGDQFDVAPPLDRAAFEALLALGPTRYTKEPRVALMARNPQMVHGIQPPTYVLDSHVVDPPVPAILSIKSLAIPPLEGTKAAAPGPAVPVVAVASTSHGGGAAERRVGSVRRRGVPDRPARLADAVQAQPVAVASADMGDSIWVFALELPSRTWRAGAIRLGSEREGRVPPGGAVAWPSTLYVPWLGYGFSHALMDTPGDPRGHGLGHGVIPLLPVDFEIAVENGRYSGVVVGRQLCGRPIGSASAEGVPMSSYAPPAAGSAR